VLLINWALEKIMGVHRSESSPIHPGELEVLASGSYSRLDDSAVTFALPSSIKEACQRYQEENQQGEAAYA